jgi:hypothetical protein
MSTISITKLYDLLSIKLGKETAENLTTFIDNKINQGLESQSNILATKEDLAKVALATKEDIARLAAATKEDISKLDSKIAALDTKISESKSETIKWMFIFWVGQMILLYFRK